MSSTIGTVGELVSVIQTQLAARAGGAPAQGVAGANKHAPARHYAPENLARLIALRVRHIGRDDPQRGRKAFRVFLEAVLLSHFGASLVNDPKFFQLIEDVQRALEADPGCRQLIGSAIEHLLSNSA